MKTINSLFCLIILNQNQTLLLYVKESRKSPKKRSLSKEFHLRALVYPLQSKLVHIFLLDDQLLFLWLLLKKNDNGSALF